MRQIAHERAATAEKLWCSTDCLTLGPRANEAAGRPTPRKSPRIGFTCDPVAVSVHALSIPRAAAIYRGSARCSRLSTTAIVDRPLDARGLLRARRPEYPKARQRWRRRPRYCRHNHGRADNTGSEASVCFGRLPSPILSPLSGMRPKVDRGCLERFLEAHVPKLLGQE